MNETPETDTPAPAAKPRRARFAVLLVLAAAGVAWGGLHVRDMIVHVETDDAYVTGTIHNLSPRLAGVIEELDVDENTPVHAGQPIAKLDTRDLDLSVTLAKAAVTEAEAATAAAEADVAQAHASIAQAETSVAQARSLVAQSEAVLVRAEQDFARSESLYRPGQNGAISRADYDASRAMRDQAAAGLEATKAGLSAAEAGVKVAQAKEHSACAAREVASSRVCSSESALKVAQLQRSYAVITAPVDGVVSRKGVETGDHVQPGQALFALVEGDVWIEANFKETQIAHIREGLEAEVRIDALPGKVLHGTIESFSPATGSSFALLPPDNATGNFTKVVQRVPIRIHLDATEAHELGGRLRPGLSAIVRVREI